MCRPSFASRESPNLAILIIFFRPPLRNMRFILPTVSTKDKCLVLYFHLQRPLTTPFHIRNFPQIWSKTTTPTNDSDATKTVVGPTCSPGLSSV